MDSGNVKIKVPRVGRATPRFYLNPRYPDIELRKGEKYHIVGKVVKKVKVY